MLETTTTHPTDEELASYTAGALGQGKKDELETHLSFCEECLQKIVSAHESVQAFTGRKTPLQGAPGMRKKFSPYLAGAVITFILSFVVPRFFLQLLAATLLLGIKWIVDAKSTKMLVMIYDAWKHGGESEAGKVLTILDRDTKKRF